MHTAGLNTTDQNNGALGRIASAGIPSALVPARAALDAVQQRLYQVAAVAHANRLLSGEDVRRVRAVMKAGASTKVRSKARADDVRLASEQLLDVLERSLAANGLPVVPGDAELAAASRLDDRVVSLLVDERPTLGDGSVEEPLTGDCIGPGGAVLVARGARGDLDVVLDVEKTDQPPADAPPPLRRGRPRRTPVGAKRRTLAELSPAELAETATRQTLVAAMQSGSTSAEALRLAGREDTPTARRWAQRVYKRWAADGQLYDRRHAPRAREPKVMSSAIAATAELLWLHHRSAAASAIRHRMLNMLNELRAKRDEGQDIAFHPLGQALLEGPVEIPAVPTLYRFFESLGPDKAKIRQVGFTEWVRQARSITKEGAWAVHANERWEIDHTPLDIHVRTLGPDGLWHQARPHLTAIIDVHSRAIMAAIVSLRAPDAFTTAIALRRAILPKREWPAWTPRGLPFCLVLDNGKDFRATDVATSLSALGIRQEFCRPHAPDEKPHIERFFGTLTRNLLPMLPGYVHGAERGEQWTPRRVDRLQTLPQLRAHLERWIVEFYHQEVHETTQRRPVELWEESVPGLSVPRREDLDVLLLQTDERLVSRGFIRFSPPSSDRKRLYFCPPLLTANGTRVLIRYNPDDLPSVMVYDALTRQRLGEAWDVNCSESPYTKTSIREQARDFRTRLAAEVKPLIQRGEAYFEHIATHDRIGTKRSAAVTAERREIRDEVDARIAAAAEALAAPGYRTTTQAAEDEDAEMEREMKARLRSAGRNRLPALSEGGSESPPSTVASAVRGASPTTPSVSSTVASTVASTATTSSSAPLPSTPLRARIA